MERQDSKGDNKAQTGQASWLTSSTLAAFVCVIIAVTSAAYLSIRAPEPSDYALRTRRVLSTTPLIDGHNDLPYLLRIELQNKIYGNNTFTFRDGKYFCLLPRIALA